VEELMSRARKVGLCVLAAVAGYVVIANLLHRAVFPPSRPDPSTYPREGDRFGSRAEGFEQLVTGVKDGWVTLRLVMAPGAQGPPMHIHERFKEVFTVESGTLHLELADRVVQLKPGEVYEIEPGVAHRPFNPTQEEVVLAGDRPVMPQSFAACLVQIYHFFDAAGGEVGPALAIRIAAMDPICDSRLPAIPTLAEGAMRWIAVPAARVFGYKSYYPEFSLHPPTEG
jgi:mannose-6-phosphate isomerase-like protein (cupin superfamily)